jgi:signal transduction histidine kinase
MKQFDVTREFLVSHNLLDFVLPAFRSSIEQRRKMLEKGIRIGSIEIEVHTPVTDKIVPVEMNSVSIIFDNQPAYLTIVRDITERRFLARRLMETIIHTEEGERSRIARDLHDEIGPLISALKIYMTSFLENENVEKKNNLAGHMGVIIRDMIESVKNISNDMSPHILVNFGLYAAIHNITDIFSNNIGIQFESNIENVRFSSIMESVVYRIIKELINNTIKHAHATSIYIRLNYDSPFLTFFYKDDGKGFDQKEFLNSNTKGMGLSNIRTRIQPLGGQMNINTSPGNGFEVNLSLRSNPVHEPEP